MPSASQASSQPTLLQSPTEPAPLFMPPEIFSGALGMSASGEGISEEASGADAAPSMQRPALVMLHDLHGLDEAANEAAERLAALGYIVLAPDLFAASDGSAGSVAPPGAAPNEPPSEAALLDFAQGLFDTQIVAAAGAALESLAARPDVDATRLGIIGWGWSGAYALMAAAHSTRPRVAIDIGGAISYPALTPQKPGSPLNFVANLEGALFAAFAGGDPLFPANEIERLRGRLIEHDKRGEVKIYHEAPPRFWRDPSLPQSQALWRRLENFLLDYLAEPETEAAFLNPQGIADDGYPNEASRLHA